MPSIKLWRKIKEAAYSLFLQFYESVILILLFPSQTPDNFEADFNEIIKKEEEESGLHLSSSTEKNPRRVRTSLEEKYAKLSKTATEVSSVPESGKEEQRDANEQQHSIITVVGAFDNNNDFGGKALQK